ncbi:MAG: F0F1 ATP synthase subunit A [Candidatus Peribacteraceae bacterium]|jgi:F-type H+-transporting ATPase subunit a
MASVEAPTLASETIAHLGSFEIRNTLIMAWLAMAVLIIVALFTRATKYKEVPGRFQSLMEMIVEGFFNFWDSVVGDRKQTRLFFPLVTTIFIFLATANWMGIFPGVGSITIEGMHNGHLVDMPIFRSMNADVNMTLAVALISVIMTQVFGVVMLGILPYAGKFFVPPWKDPIGTFIGILELLAEIAKVISFSFRLFGNIFAGEVLLVVISFLMPYVAPIPFLGLEIFVGFIQALVFSMLTLVFLKMAVTAHGGHEEHEGHGHGELAPAAVKG